MNDMLLTEAIKTKTTMEHPSTKDTTITQVTQDQYLPLSVTIFDDIYR